jgi:YD repeat-containing protein
LIKTTLPEGNAIETECDDAPCLAQLRCTHNVKTVRQVAKSGSGLPNLTSSFTYESNFNRPNTATDAKGQVTNFTYTPQGLPLTVTSPPDTNSVQPVTTYGYTSFTAPGFLPFWLQTSVTQKINSTSSVVTTTAYNTGNKYVPQSVVVNQGSGKLNLTTTLTFDAIGNPTVVNGPRTDVTNDTVTNTFDAERRVTQSTNALGKLSRNAYDADGRLTRSAAQINAAWLVSCRSYSPSGKLIKAWGPSQTSADTTCPVTPDPTVPVTDITYDDLDRPNRTTQSLTVAEGGSRITDTVYNPDDTVQSVQRAVGSPVAQTYASYVMPWNERRRGFDRPLAACRLQISVTDATGLGLHENLLSCHSRDI